MLIFGIVILCISHLHFNLHEFLFECFLHKGFENEETNDLFCLLISILFYQRVRTLRYESNEKQNSLDYDQNDVEEQHDSIEDESLSITSRKDQTECIGDHYTYQYEKLSENTKSSNNLSRSKLIDVDWDDRQVVTYKNSL